MSNQPSNQSTTSLDSATTLVSSTPSNTTHLQPPPQKDYAAALGALQSRYGTGGLTPSPKMEASKKLPAQNTAGASSSTVYNHAQGSSATGTPSSSISSLNSLGSASSQKGKESKDKKSLFRSLLKGKGKGKEKEKEKEKDDDSSKSQS
ncbi:hypothetical protein BDQ17DRAFT_1331669 [Cyathus striatus]|nr:hypothetical protein BDQ17DRAFT_1331669 [Cyathus striatus]